MKYLRFKKIIELQFFLRLDFLFFFCFLGLGVANAQTVPKTAQPERIEERFQLPVTPKSTLETIIPESKAPLSSAEMEKITFILTGVTVVGSTVYKPTDLFDFYKRYLNKKISLINIYGIADALTAKYRNDGYMLSQAIVPQQAFQMGVVKIQIIEGFVDDFLINGNIDGSKKLLESYAKKLMKSRPLRAKDLERYLLLINDLPGVKAKSILSPSNRKQGASILTLVADRKAYDGFLSFNNRGTVFNGPLQKSGGVNLNSILGLNERTGVQVVNSGSAEELIFVSGFHDQQIGSEGSKISLSFNYSLTEPGFNLEQFNIEGQTSSLTAKISHPFIRSREQNLSGYVGFTLRQSKTDIFKQLNSEDRLRFFRIGFSYDFVDRFRGVNLFGLEYRQGVDFFNAKETGSDLLTRARGKSDFNKISGNVLRFQKITQSVSFSSEAIWQYGFSQLLASEEFGLGGPRFVRAYDPSEVTGNHGVAVKGEFQYARQSKLKYLKGYQTYTFFDYGVVWDKGALEGETGHNILSSAGAGIRFNFKDWVSGWVEAAKPLRQRVETEGDKDFRIFFSLLVRF